MSSEIIVILVLVALAIGGIIYLELHSRRNERSAEQQIQSDDGD